MLVVTKIEVLETQSNVCEIIRQSAASEFDTFIEFNTNSGEVVIKDVKEVKELIKGRRFSRPSKGTDIFIGLSNEVAEILGLQFEAFDNMQNEISCLTNQISALKQELTLVNNFSFWKRLKCLFFGFKNTVHTFEAKNANKK